MKEVDVSNRHLQVVVFRLSNEIIILKRSNLKEVEINNSSNSIEHQPNHHQKNQVRADQL
jgi:hypothetical protein